MDNPNYTTEHRKGQHLLNEERYEIVVRLKDGWSIYKIVKHLGRAYNTIKDEVERGTVTLYSGKVKRYKADRNFRLWQTLPQQYFYLRTFFPRQVLEFPLFCGILFPNHSRPPWLFVVS